MSKLINKPKWILISHGDELKFLYDWCAIHEDLYRMYKSEHTGDFKVLGGGWWYLDEDILYLYGTSLDYNSPSKDNMLNAAEIIKNTVWVDKVLWVDNPVLQQEVKCYKLLLMKENIWFNLETKENEFYCV